MMLNEAVGILCTKYPNISEDASAFPADLPQIVLDAGDEILPENFDHLLEVIEEQLDIGIVKTDVLLCGNRRRLLKAGGEIAVGSGEKTVSIEEIALVRHGWKDDTIGEAWMEIRIKPPSAFKRAYICYNENGFWYTMRRIFFGKKSK